MKEAGDAVGSGGSASPGANRTVVPGTFADVLGRAIAARGRSLKWLHDRLAARGNPVAIATLSYWRSGQRRPDGADSLAAVADLEELLDLAPGELMHRIVPPARRGPLASAALVPSAGYDLTDLQEASDRLHVEQPDGIRTISSSITVDVDADGAQRRTNVRAVLQAREDGVATFRHMVYALTAQQQSPQYHAGDGCRISDTHDHPGRKVFGAVLALDRVLQAGETTVVEFWVDLPPSFANDDWYQHTTTGRLREVLLWVRFDRRLVPVRYEEYNDVNTEVTSVHRAVSGQSIHLVRRDFGPGAVGLRWSH